MSESLEELRKRYQTFATDDLFAIVTTDSNDYRPAAVRIAHEELRRRGVPEGLVLDAHPGLVLIRDRTGGASEPFGGVGARPDEHQPAVGDTVLVEIDEEPPAEIVAVQLWDKFTREIVEQGYEKLWETHPQVIEKRYEDIKTSVDRIGLRAAMSKTAPTTEA